MAPSSVTASSAAQNVKSLLDDPVISEVAKELSKIPKNDLAALLDRTILPRIQVKTVWIPGRLEHWPLRCEVIRWDCLVEV